jgi:hypothetical protein
MLHLSHVSSGIEVSVGEDTRFPVMMLHGLALHEAVEMIDLEAKIPELLVHGSALRLRLRLGLSHLQGNEPLFSALIHILNALLQLVATTLDLLSKTLQTLVHPLIQMLELLKHQPKV